VQGGPQKEATGERLSAWQRAFGEQLRKILAQLTPPPLNLARLPSELRSRYVSADGTYALYINPKYDLWDRSRLASFVKEIEARVAQVPNSPPVTGIAPNIHYSTAGVERAFYKATVYAFVLIFVLVLIDLRRLGQTLGAISVLALGLPMLVALMGLFGISWNFANFFGLPILIGAAHEYGVFMMHRYREALHDHRRVWEFWDVSDRALLLCAFVTSSSFAFFWALGHHEGLKSLGLVMALGSACIYLATILVLRPLLIWRLERHHAHADKAGVVSNSRRVRS
jgi:predicted RND superfamily exporter protein